MIRLFPVSCPWQPRRAALPRLAALPQLAALPRRAALRLLAALPRPAAFRLPLLSVLVLLCAACAGKSGGGQVPTVALALDGPPLVVVGEYAGKRLTGSLERAGMVGHGKLFLRGEETGGEFDGEFVCEAQLDAPPTEKGRVRGLLRCGGNRVIPVTLRNLGPDQGVGIARESADSDLMVLFFHPSAEEAERRFPKVREDIEWARSGGRRGDSARDAEEESNDGVTKAPAGV